jgi:hypothetical protein
MQGILRILTQGLVLLFSRLHILLGELGDSFEIGTGEYQGLIRERGMEYVEEQAHGGADDRALKQRDAGRKAEEIGMLEVYDFEPGSSLSRCT